MKSLILSSGITAAVALIIMLLFDSRMGDLFDRLPEWSLWLTAGICLLGYIISFYWGITGVFKQQRFFNFLGIFFSLLGFSIYITGYIMNAGKGKETPGQFDHSLSAIESTQRAALDSLLKQTGTKASNINTVSYWKMDKNPDDFVICVQKGNVIALQLKNKTLTGLNNVAGLKKLNWLTLDNCAVESLQGLNLKELQRLYVPHNKLKNLQGIENSPTIGWLDYSDNPITDSSSLSAFSEKNLFIVKD